MNKKSSAFLTMGTLTLLAGGGVVLTNLPDSFKIERVYAATSRQVIVLPTDFLTNFQRNGSAAGFDYDLTTYTQTLTPNQASQAGNVTLKTKVDMSQNFTFTGEINLGDKAQNAGGTGDSSNYTTSADIKSYTDAGYELVSDNYPSGGTVFTDTAQHYVVNLKQKLVVSSEQKQVNETIQYVYEDGSKAADDYNAPPLNFTRSVTTNQVTGEKTYGDWQAQNGDSFGEVVSPTIKGETADQLKIDAISGITANSADIQKKLFINVTKEPLMLLTLMKQLVKF
ncbi:internalin putative (LPXTG motif) [Lactococcus lactis subsp. lactis]|uniref:mucin-binding protein n=1 Tax=Lactococcus lactis TaxID=1358 RepID=UPI0007283704|nr:hypothetical protein [Lactococcus lactis]KST82009.1 internalin putative (LPXTG motif) [Lactococcus lactis subsp. lactis]